MILTQRKCERVFPVSMARAREMDEMEVENYLITMQPVGLSVKHTQCNPSSIRLIYIQNTNRRIIVNA